MIDLMKPKEAQATLRYYDDYGIFIERERRYRSLHRELLDLTSSSSAPTEKVAELWEQLRVHHTEMLRSALRLEALACHVVDIGHRAVNVPTAVRGSSLASLTHGRWQSYEIFTREWRRFNELAGFVDDEGP